MSRPPRVLFAAYYFPPVGGGGVTRTLRAVRALAEAGFEPWVLTVDDAAWSRDASRAAEVPRRARVLRLPNPDWGRVAAALPRRGGVAGAAGGGGRLRRWLVPDLHVAWSGLAAGTGALLAALRAVDLVWASAPPYSAFAVGAAAGALGVPWVADFRDGWTCCPTRTDLPPRRVAFERRLEGAVLRRASRVLFASPAVRAHCTEREPGLDARSETLLTGYDPREAARIRRPGRHAAEGVLELVHAGCVLGARREATLAHFLGALRRLLVRDPGLHGRLRVRLLGAEPALEPRLRGLAPVVRLEPARPRAALLRLLAAADAALVLQPSGPRGGDPIPGKLFDAAAARVPVLAVAPSGALPDLVATHRLGLALPPEAEEALADALAEALARVARGEVAFGPGAPRFEALSGELYARRAVAVAESLLTVGGEVRWPSPSAS